jgi:hypothetical protein
LYIQDQCPWLPFSVLVGIRSETEGLICGTRLILKENYKLLLSQVKVANHGSE